MEKLLSISKLSALEQKREVSRRVTGVLCAVMALGLKYGQLVQRVRSGNFREAFSKENCPWKASRMVYDFMTDVKS